MISEHTALNTATPKLFVGPWLAPFSRQRVAGGIGTSFAQLTRALTAWARVPALPHAALWEATIMVGLLTERESHTSGPFATEMPFMTDGWPRA
jgi:hypothetical protein